MESFADLYGVIFNPERIATPQLVIDRTPSRGKRVVQALVGAPVLASSLAGILGMQGDDPVQKVLAKAAAVCRQDWLLLHWPYAGARNALAAPFNGSLLIGIPGEGDSWYDRIAVRTNDVSLLVDYANAPALRMTAVQNKHKGEVLRYEREGDVLLMPPSMPQALQNQLGLLLYLVKGSATR